MEFTAYARPGKNGEVGELLTHHLLETKRLCVSYTSEFTNPVAGEWLGFYHDFGKYGQYFQDVLAGTRHHVDHAIPGSALLLAKLIGSVPAGHIFADSSLWPYIVAVRAHHSELSFFCEKDIVQWTRKFHTTTEDGSSVSISSKPEFLSANAVDLETGKMIAPHGGAGIETPPSAAAARSGSIAPHGGAGIETSDARRTSPATGHCPSRRGKNRNSSCYLKTKAETTPRSFQPPWGFVLTFQMKIIQENHGLYPGLHVLPYVP